MRASKRGVDDGREARQRVGRTSSMADRTGEGFRGRTGLLSDAVNDGSDAGWRRRAAASSGLGRVKG